MMAIDRNSTMLIWFSALAVYLFSVHIISDACTTSENQMCGFVDYVLASPSFNQSIAKTQKLCFNLCLQHPNCKSVNYFLKTRQCALNNVSHIDGCQELKMMSGTFYAYTERKTDGNAGPNYGLTTSVAETTTRRVWIEREVSLVGMVSQQSSTYIIPYLAEKANDGHTNVLMTMSPYCAHTESSSHPWWRVDMSEEHLLGRITIVNRGDCCGDRLVGATVRVGLSADVLSNAVCGNAVTAAEALNGAWIDKVCDPPTWARFVSVDVDHGEDAAALQLCEVMVKEYV